MRIEGGRNMKVRARYRLAGANPFELRPSETVKIEGEASDDMTMEELEKFAQEHIPKGYEFIEVEILKPI